ncbi:MAG TPA: hypothetical protein PLH72_00445 [Vicinamibacterales bacterium]|nr:hypothetical protein [Vicinamibacterales bacterium]
MSPRCRVAAPAVRAGGKLTALALTLLALVMPASSFAGPASTPRPVARTVLALYDSALEATPRDTRVHALAEMPLNHLGLVVKYHDIRTGLPTPEALRGVRGVITWFVDDAMPNPRAYLRWVDTLSRGGVPLVVMGALGALMDEQGTLVPTDEVNTALARLGWRYDGDWHSTTAGASYSVQDPRIVGFERRLPRLVPPYAAVRATAPDARTALRVSMPGQPPAEADLVIISPRGAYVAPGYAYFADRSDDREFRQWYLNPFEFFREAFDTDQVPKLDTATLSGRRIYYSHIDGDGWRNLTQIEPYRSRYVIAARVVLDEILRRFPDLPVSVGAIVGDLDPAWKGTQESLAVARDLYRLPHVEPAIHTYSHPLDWGFFQASLTRGVDEGYAPTSTTAVGGSDVLHGDAGVKPRSYDTRPFSLATEIDDARAFVDALLPPGKRVQLLQWSGDTRPFAEALAHTRRAGLVNINGGDTRFDRDFPSTAWVSPLGVETGSERQVYASNSNENTYTDLWRDRFFGFSFLTRTVRNTGSPRRLKPFNLYYHMYSGERLSSLNAVLANLAYARSLPLAPIEASRFSRIVEGFFSATLEQVGPRAWLVRDRGAVQTVRFDAASLAGVDFDRSVGVIGQRHEMGSLFVALDETVDAPRVAIRTMGTAELEPAERIPYLVESRWRVYGVHHEVGVVRFITEGYGPGESVWQWPYGPSADVRWHSSSGRTGVMQVQTDASGLLPVGLPQSTGERVEVTIAGSGADRASR